MGNISRVNGFVYVAFVGSDLVCLLCLGLHSCKTTGNRDNCWNEQKYSQDKNKHVHRKICSRMNYKERHT